MMLGTDITGAIVMMTIGVKLLDRSTYELDGDERETTIRQHMMELS
jgi:hypothetical protein